MNFNTVIAVAIAMSVEYAKVQANWFLKPLPQQLQVLPIQLIHRDSHIRMEQNDEYTADTESAQKFAHEQVRLIRGLTVRFKYIDRIAAPISFV